jgi:hypothetical protein
VLDAAPELGHSWRTGSSPPAPSSDRSCRWSPRGSPRRSPSSTAAST